MILSVKRLNSICFILFILISVYLKADDTIDDPFIKKREEMVETQLISKGIKNEVVLNAMRMVPREKFMEEYLHDFAYNDGFAPIALF